MRIFICAMITFFTLQNSAFAGCTGCGDAYTGYFDRTVYAANYSNRAIVRISAVSYNADVETVEILLDAVLHGNTGFELWYEFRGSDCTRKLEVLFNDNRGSTLEGFNMCEATNLVISEDRQLSVFYE